MPLPTSLLFAYLCAQIEGCGLLPQRPSWRASLPVVIAVILVSQVHAGSATLISLGIIAAIAYRLGAAQAREDRMPSRRRRKAA